MSARRTSRKWLVIRGISEDWVRNAIFRSPKNDRRQVFVWVIEKDKTDAHAFRLRLNVVEVYAGNRMLLPEEKTSKWDGNFYVEAYCESRPQLLEGSDQNLQLRVKVSGWIGKARALELEILGIG